MDMDSLLCKNLVQHFPWSVTHSSTIYGDNYAILVEPGDGTSSSYASGGGFGGSYSHLYNDTGTYNAKISLFYKASFGSGTLNGPVMVKEKKVYLQNCHAVNVRYYSDINQNCQKNTTEPWYNMNNGYGLMHSVMRNGGNPYVANTDGSITSYIWGNDTVYRPEYLGYTNPYPTGWGSNYFQILPRPCSPSYITKADDSAKFAYNPAIIIGDLDDNSGGLRCKGDTLTFTLHGNAKGYNSGTPLRLLAIYTDGFTDTFNFTPAVMDSFSYTFRKSIVTTGSFSASFVLSGTNGIVADTLVKPFNGGGCARIIVKTFYDKNKNCLKDANEPFLKDFRLESQGTGLLNNTMLDSQTVRINTYGLNDTLLQVRLYGNSQLGRGVYFRSFTEPICSWPVFPFDTGTYIIPLVDTTSVNQAGLVNGYNLWPETANILPCESTYHPVLKGWLQGNRNASNHYYFKYSAGNGAPADSIPYPAGDYYESITDYYYLSAPNTVYTTGSYIPNYLLINGLIHDTVLHYQRPAPALAVNLNCQLPKAQLFVDENGDCLKNTAEQGLSNTLVSVLQNGTGFNTITDVEGRVYFNAVNGDQINITVPQYLPSGKSLDMNCVPGNVNTFVYNNNNPVPNFSFPYTCAASGNIDVGVAVSHSFYTNLQNDTIIIYPQLSGCYYDSAVLSLTLDNAITFIAASLPGQQQSGNTIRWDITDLSTLQNTPVKVAVSLNNAQAGFLCNTVKLYATVPDADSGNNEFVLCDSVYSNIPIQIKTGITDSVYLQDHTPVIYSIHFQNPGPDTVSQVVVVDTISAAFNINSLQMLNASHYYILSIAQSHVLRFEFPNIHMAPGESGLIQFLLTPDIAITPGTVIYNNAAIVYGGNGAVMTGPASTSAMPPPLALEEQSSLPAHGIMAYPNPTAGQLTVVVSGKTGAHGFVGIYDITGKLLVRQKAGRITGINMRIMPSGIYLLKYEDDQWSHVIKVVKTE